MRVFNDLNELPNFRKAVVTIGSFDGVHLGHQKILAQVKDLAQSIDGESIVITFHPHPRLVIYPNDNSLELITSIDEKISLLSRYGIDNVVVVPFTVAFSQQSADEYIQKFLVEKFSPLYIVIGYDHRFGLNRQGDINYLKWHGEPSGYEVVEIARHDVDHLAVSSTKIRNALNLGEMKVAQKLMGHYFLLTGIVVHGNKIGSQLGFPTANLKVSQKNKLIPPTGIYAVYVHHQGQRYGGMLYIGDRPTLKEFHNWTIEVNIFDFGKDIYGDKIQFEFLTRIRDDQQFDNLDDLRTQLKEDRHSALNVIQEIAEKAPISTTTQPKVAIVILNYNGQSQLEQFLPSVMATTYQNHEIIIADNGSSDDSVAFLKDNYPAIKILDLKENHGYAGGYNLALQDIDSPYYILLNSDVEVTPDWIEPIVELMERDATVGACQPKILSFHDKDKFEYAGASGGWLDNLGYPFCRGRIFAVTETDEGQYNDLQEIFWASGAALFIRKQLFHQLGGFDASYFAHSEEIDLCWRLKRAGYKVMVRPRSVVYHVGGSTLNYNNPRKTYLNFRNSLFTLLKNETRERLLWILPLRLILDCVAGLLFLSQGKFQHIKSIIRAHWDFFPKIKTTIAQRKSINELVQKVSISEEANLTGRYKGSVVWQYYARGKKYFRKL